MVQVQNLRDRKAERATKWEADRKTREATIFELHRVIRRLEVELRILKEIAVAEAAEEAKKNSWVTWIWSPLYKPIQESEAELERKDRARQERLVEKGLKERRLAAEQATLKKNEESLATRSKEIAAADREDDAGIAGLCRLINLKQARERSARESAARQREAELRKQQQEEADRRAREAAKAHQERMAKMERERREREGQRRRTQNGSRWYSDDYDYYGRDERGGTSSSCDHGGWWPKVQGRANCPVCYEQWTYLLSCPGCQRLACPRCQSDLKPRRRRF